MVKKTLSLVATFLCTVLTLLAQVGEAEKKYTAFDMRQNGKIYVVVAVIVVILAGLLLYLVRLDKKITRLEKGLKA